MAGLATADPILETQGLTKRFGGFVALDKVELQIRAGEFHAVIGPNGAGKTTLFNLLTGDLTPSEGRIIWLGRDMSRLAPHLRVHLGIGRSYQITNLFPNLTVLENVRLAVQAGAAGNRAGWPAPGWLRLPAAARLEGPALQADRVLDQVGLLAMRGERVRTLSHGDQRKLELAMVLASDPHLLLLDEPTAGMSHEEVPAILDVIRSLRESGRRTVVLVEHKMDVVLALSDRITVLNLGRVIASGPPDVIVDDETVQAAYLGGMGDLAASGA